MEGKKCNQKKCEKHVRKKLETYTEGQEDRAK